jgi:hypothetical protein
MRQVVRHRCGAVHQYIVKNNRSTMMYGTGSVPYNLADRRRICGSHFLRRGLADRRQPLTGLSRRRPSAPNPKSSALPLCSLRAERRAPRGVEKGLGAAKRAAVWALLCALCCFLAAADCWRRTTSDNNPLSPRIHRRRPAPAALLALFLSRIGPVAAARRPGRRRRRRFSSRACRRPPPAAHEGSRAGQPLRCPRRGRRAAAPGAEGVEQQSDARSPPELTAEALARRSTIRARRRRRGRFLTSFTVSASTNFPDCSMQCTRPRWECTKINTVSCETGVRCTLPTRACTLGCIIGRALGMGNVLGVQMHWLQDLARSAGFDSNNV